MQELDGLVLASLAEGDQRGEQRRTGDRRRAVGEEVLAGAGVMAPPEPIRHERRHGERRSPFDRRTQDDVLIFQPVINDLAVLERVI